ncbi:MAG TPA: hypothetical protein VGG63_05610 [Steroidobacteraceae bacterium]|jgi:hypothetical protein
MMKSLIHSLAVLSLIALAGCGLAATSVTTAAGGASAAQNAKQAKETEAKVQQQINAAYQQDAAQRKAAEAQAQ